MSLSAVCMRFSRTRHNIQKLRVHTFEHVIIHWSMDTILYLYPVRKTENHGAETGRIKEQNPCRPDGWWGKLRKILSCPRITARNDGEERTGLQLSRTEYFFPDYRLVKVAVASCREESGMSAAPKESRGETYKRLGQNLREQLYELTEDPDHTYVVCREPLSFYFGREFSDYRQQDWVEHLLRYGEDAEGYPLWPDLILLGRNYYLPYIMLRYAGALRNVSWYLTQRQYREEEDLLVEELEEEYGLIPVLRLMATDADYARVQLKETHPCVVLDFSDSEKVHGGGLPVGSVWLDFAASEEKERRLAGQCPQIRYFSLKKEWKAPRKALEYLDTISKNGYNNSVD